MFSLESLQSFLFLVDIEQVLLMLRELSHNLALLRGHDQQGVLFRRGKDDSELEIRRWLGNPVLFLLYPASLTLL